MMDKPDVSHGSFAPDMALKELEEPQHYEVSPGERAAFEKSVWRKLDRRILPICTMFYLLSFTDRSNISNARVAGLQKSLNMSDYDYTVALTVTYVSYICAELPSNLVLKRIGPNRLLPALVTMWGMVSALQGVVHNYSGLIACRFFLGLMEGGLFPGLILYLSLFYPRKRLHIRVATFFASASLASAFSGMFAAGFTHFDGMAGRPGWAWIFIFEGFPACIFGIVSFFTFPHSPERVRFLSEEERKYVARSLKEAGAVSRDDMADSFSWTEVIEATKSPHVLILCIVLFFNGSTLYALAYFEPSIVATLGYVGNQAQLMSAPPFVCAFICSMISSFISDHYDCRGLTVIFFSLMEVIGFSLFYASKSSHVRYGSLFFSTTGAYGAAPALATWVANNGAPHVRRATAIAMAFIVTSAGGILSTWLLGALSASPDYTKATITLMIMSVGMAVFATINLAYLSRENRLKAERRLKMTREAEPAGLGDRSAWFIYSL